MAYIYLCRYVCDYDGDSILINFHKIHRLPAIFCTSLFGCCLLTIGSITFSVLSLSLQLLNEFLTEKVFTTKQFSHKKKERERIAYSKQKKRKKNRIIFHETMWKCKWKCNTSWHTVFNWETARCVQRDEKSKQANQQQQQQQKIHAKV